MILLWRVSNVSNFIVSLLEFGTRFECSVVLLSWIFCVLLLVKYGRAGGIPKGDCCTREEIGYPGFQEQWSLCGGQAWESGDSKLYYDSFDSKLHEFVDDPSYISSLIQNPIALRP